MISSASASEINETQTLSLPSDMSDNNDDVLSVENVNDSSADKNSGNLLGESNGNSNDLLGADAGTFADLQTIITNARAGSTVTLDRDYNIGSGTYITIDKRLTINGNGFTLDANNKNNVFWVMYDDVTLKNLNLINGKLASGGLIYVQNSNCVIDNCTFRNGVSTGYGGGAIATDGNNLKVTNSKFYSCKSTSTNSGQGYAGAIFFRETKIGSSSTLNNLTAGLVENCYFESSTSVNDAGAIKAYCKNIIIKNNTFINSQCTNNTHWAGAVMVHNSDNAQILDSTFINSSSKNKGGSVVVQSSPNTIIDNCIFNNSVVTYSTDNAYAGGWAGAIYITGDSAGCTVSNSSFTKCTSSNHGGAIYVNSNNVIIYNCSATNCFSERGGVFFIAGDNCKILYCNGIDNSCGHGTVIYARDLDNRAEDQKVYNLLVDHCSFYNNYASVSEASFYIVGQDCTISNCVLVNNTSNAFTGKFTLGNNNVLVNSIIYNNSDLNVLSMDRGSFTANNNWFGNTQDDYITAPIVSGGVVLDQWYFLTLAANQSIVAEGQTVLMDIGLNGLYDSKTGKVTKSTKYDLPFDMVPDTYLPPVFDINTDNGVTNQSTILFRHDTHTFEYTPEHTDSGTVTLGNVINMFMSDTVTVIKAGSFTDLYNRINYTEENATLDLPYDFTYNETYDPAHLDSLYGLDDVSGGLPIDKNLTINGNDKTIDALNKVDIFNITSNVELENVNLQNGQINNNGNLTLKNVEHRGTTYSIVNNGNLYLEKDYDLMTIKNNGMIYGPFTITVMENKTIILQIDSRIANINATTDFGVTIEGGKLSFINIPKFEILIFLEYEFSDVDMKTI